MLRDKHGTNWVVPSNAGCPKEIKLFVFFFYFYDRYTSKGKVWCYLFLVVLVVDEHGEYERGGLVEARALGQRLGRGQEPAQRHARQDRPAVCAQARRGERVAGGTSICSVDKPLAGLDQW